MHRRIAAFAFAVLILAGGWTFRKPVLIAVFSTIGRNPHCQAAPAIKLHTRIATDWILKDARVTELRSDARDFTLWRTPLGEFWAPPNTYMKVNVREQVLDFYGTGAQAVHRGDVVLDCGANIGLFTRKALDLGASRVISIEPSLDIIECLRRNFPREIAAGKVTVVTEGVWDSEGKLAFEIDEENRGGDRIVAVNGKATKQKVVEVPVTTIDALVAKLGLERVDFIKMDIEGSEVPALNGARSTLSRFRPRLALAAYHKKDDAVTIPRAVRAGNPGYGTECGICLIQQTRLRPMIMFFR